MPVFCFSFVPSSEHDGKRRRKGRGSSKGGTGSTFPSPWDAAPSIQTSQCPGGVCSVTVQGQLGFQVQKGSRSLVLALQSSLGKPKEPVLLLSLPVYARAGMLVPRKGQSAQVWMHLEALAVLLPGEGGPSSSRSNHRAGRFFTAHFCFSEQQPQKMHTSFFCQHGSDT